MAIHPGRGEESDRKEVETSRSIPEKPRRATGFPDPGIFITPGTDRPGGLSCPTPSPCGLWLRNAPRPRQDASQRPVASGSFLTVFQRFAGDAAPWINPPAGSGIPLHPKKPVGNSVHSFKAYKPSIWEEESFRRYMESREEALPAGTQRPWWKFWGAG